MLNPLRAIRIFDDVGRAAKAFFNVAAFERRLAKQIRAALGMDRAVRQGASAACGSVTGSRTSYSISINVRRFAGKILRVSNDTGNDVATATSFLADRNEHRPIFLDETHVAFARDISRGNNAVDAIERKGASADRFATLCAGMIGQTDRRRTACSARPCRR